MGVEQPFMSYTHMVQRFDTWGISPGGGAASVLTCGWGYSRYHSQTEAGQWSQAGPRGGTGACCAHTLYNRVTWQGSSSTW